MQSDGLDIFRDVYQEVLSEKARAEYAEQQTREAAEHKRARQLTWLLSALGVSDHVLWFDAPPDTPTIEFGDYRFELVSFRDAVPNGDDHIYTFQLIVGMSATTSKRLGISPTAHDHARHEPALISADLPKLRLWIGECLYRVDVAIVKAEATRAERIRRNEDAAQALTFVKLLWCDPTTNFERERFQRESDVLVTEGYEMKALIQSNNDTGESLLTAYFQRPFRREIS